MCVCVFPCVFCCCCLFVCLFVGLLFVVAAFCKFCYAAAEEPVHDLKTEGRKETREGGGVGRGPG